MIGAVQGNIQNSYLYKMKTLVREIKFARLLQSIYNHGLFKQNSVVDKFQSRMRIKDSRRSSIKFVLSSYYYSYEINGYDKTQQIVEELFTLRNEIQLSLKQRWGDDLQGVGGNICGKEILLYNLVLKYKPNIVIETGVAQGISSRFILEALKKNNHGILISVDLPNYVESGKINSDGQFDGVHVKKDLGVGWLVPEELKDRWELYLGDAKSILPSIKEDADIFVHDSDHSYGHMMFEFEFASKHLSENGILVSDDIGWNSSFNDFLSLHQDAFAAIYVDKFTGIVRKKPTLAQVT